MTTTKSDIINGLKAKPRPENDTRPLWVERKHMKKALSDVVEEKGGEGSGNFGHSGLAGVHGGSGGKPDLGKVATGRVKFEKNRLAREVVASAANVKRLDEKTFRTPKDRLEARKHMKQMRKKLKQLDMKEEDVWEVLDQIPIEEQMFIASAAKLDNPTGKTAKVMQNVGKHMLNLNIQKAGEKYAPSPLLESDDVKKLSLFETAAYLAAHDDPDRATNFIKSLGSADFKKANQLRQQGFQNVISNTQRNVRNKEWLDSAAAVHARMSARKRRDPGFQFPTQREFTKLVSEEVKDRSAAALRQHRGEQGEPVIRFGGFGGQI